MKPLHVVLAVLITAIWGVNFSVIKLGLATVDPFILAGIRFSLCALPAIFFIRKPNVPWRYIIGYGLVFGIGLWGIVNLGIKAGLSAGIASAWTAMPRLTPLTKIQSCTAGTRSIARAPTTSTTRRIRTVRTRLNRFCILPSRPARPEGPAELTKWSIGRN